MGSVTMPQPSAERPATRHTTSRLDRFLMQGGIVITFLVVALVATALVEPRFLNRLNLINVLRNFSFLVIPSLAQMLIMTAGGFDLSVGAVVAVSSVVAAAVMLTGLAAFPGMETMVILMALAAVIGVGVLVGLVNAGLIATFALSPFMVTLAMMSVLTGIVLFYTQGIPIYGVA
ncbi:MAG: ABC transporter permease, partial [Rhizobiaceae bacterium]|nr:ABC transporter permease [Rhizobiaceae bacterium]